MTGRSNRAEVRNPVLALPAFDQLAAMHPAARRALGAVLGDLSAESRLRAEQCWRKHKAPMAVYWKAVSVYARHIRLALEAAKSRPSVPSPGVLEAALLDAPIRDLLDRQEREYASAGMETDNKDRAELIARFLMDRARNAE